MFNWSMLLALLGINGGMPRQRSGRYGRPTGTDLRNPADPIQAARIEAAAAKRTRRAEKLTVNMKRTVANSAHFGFLYEAHDERVYGIPDRLNPFHIAL
jgi:hypothetical protein